MNDLPLLTIVVPVLDEAAALPGLLDHLSGLSGRPEVILVDGGSRDATVAIARAHPLRPLIVVAPRGRALQMNAGAARANGEVLLFLHADTVIAPGAVSSIAQALSNPRTVGGNFVVRFDGGDRFSRVLAAWMALQRHAGIYYGDSGIWLRRSVFEGLSGFRALPIMEDYDLVRRLERAGSTVCLPGPVLTSARRWKQLGLARTIATWVLIRWLFLAGVSPGRLARLYPKVRQPVAGNPTNRESAVADSSDKVQERRDDDEH